MGKVKNSPSGYLKRSQMRTASVLVELVQEKPKKRTADDFIRAVIDRNFYVNFRTDHEESGKNKES